MLKFFNNFVLFTHENRITPNLILFRLPEQNKKQKYETKVHKKYFWGGPVLSFQHFYTTSGAPEQGGGGGGVMNKPEWYDFQPQIRHFLIHVMNQPLSFIHTLAYCSRDL